MAIRGRLTTVLVVFGVILAALVVGLFIATRVFAQSDRVCRGVAVNGIDLSGMTRADAEASLQSCARSRSAEVLTLRAGGRTWSGAIGGLGVAFKWQEAARKAWLVGRSGGLVQRSRDILGVSGKGHFDIPVVVNPAVLEDTLEKVAKAVDRPHSNASVRMVAGQFDVKPERDGLALDEEAALAAVRQAVKTRSAFADLPVVVDKPAITAADLRSINGVLAQYTTRFHSYERDRTENLRIAAKAINGSVLKPGEQLSYNTIVGPRAAERGYRSAKIFVKGKVEPGLGGGICQVSSTLYNAVLLAGLKVDQRYHHSRVVVYVPAGRDATVAYGSRDFKFTNTYADPIYIGANVMGSKLHVAIYGSIEERPTVKVWSSASRYGTAKAAVTVVDPTLKPGKKKVTDKGSRGVAAVVYRSITKAGTSVTEVVSRDKYPPQPKIISIGQKPEPKTSDGTPAVASAQNNGAPRAD